MAAICNNDSLIDELISNSRYRIEPSGKIFIWLLTTKVWKETGIFRCRDGYHKVPYKGKPLRVHRIIYRKFNGPLVDSLFVNHIDGNKSNNKPENLELVTAEENNLLAQKLGLFARTERKRKATKHADDIQKWHDSGCINLCIARRLNLDPSDIQTFIRMNDLLSNRFNRP